MAVLGSAFNTGYRQAIGSDLAGLPQTVADQAREAPAIAIQVARGLADGTFLEHAAQEAFTSGMRVSLLLGMGLLLLGALYVWLHGSSRDEQVLEDELDAPEEAPQREPISAGA